MLQLLERKWSAIAMQTAWKLEPVFYNSFAHVPSPSSPSELSPIVESCPDHNNISLIPGMQAWTLQLLMTRVTRGDSRKVRGELARMIETTLLIYRVRDHAYYITHAHWAVKC